MASIGEGFEGERLLGVGRALRAGQVALEENTGLGGKPFGNGSTGRLGTTIAPNGGKIERNNVIFSTESCRLLSDRMGSAIRRQCLWCYTAKAMPYNTGVRIINC